MKQAFNKFFSLIEENINDTQKDYENAVNYILHSSAVFTRGQLQFLTVPKMFTEDAFKIIEDAGITIHGILKKVIDKYLEDSSYRSLFDFSKELEELILGDCGYGSRIPIARIDLFFNDDTFNFKFCEFNADGASAMNEDREIGNAFLESKLWRRFGESYIIKTFELFDSWVEEFLEIYSNYKNHIENPNVAIVDFLDLGTKSEFVVFKEAFLKRGINASIVDIRDLRFESNCLLDKNGVRIDAIYRRAVTSECMEKINQIPHFIAAVKANAVCVIGAFRTQIIHNKNIFRILKLKETKDFLTKEENEFIDKHIPTTYLLKKGFFNTEDIKKDKDNWLIKPADKYGSYGVIDGKSCTTEEWENLLNTKMDEDYILQEYCTPYKTKNVFFKNGIPNFDNYNSMTGLFLYNGKVKGLYTRSMTKRITTQKEEGFVVCSVRVVPV